MIFLTSGQDLGPMPGEVAYAAGKGALSSITRTPRAVSAAERRGLVVSMAADPDSRPIQQSFSDGRLS